MHAREAARAAGAAVASPASGTDRLAGATDFNDPDAHGAGGMFCPVNPFARGAGPGQRAPRPPSSKRPRLCLKQRRPGSWKPSNTNDAGRKTPPAKNWNMRRWSVMRRWHHSSRGCSVRMPPLAALAAPFSVMARSHPNGVATVGRQVLAGHIGGGVGQQETHGPRHLARLGPAESAPGRCRGIFRCG